MKTTNDHSQTSENTALNAGTNAAIYSMTGLLCVLALIFAIRLISLFYNNSELFFDEAQYWAWAQNLDFGYFSKPPVLAWIIRVSTEICGSDSAFCVRLSAPIIHTVTAVFIFLGTRELFDQKTGFWAGVIFILLPAVSLSATIISTDVPLLMFWSIALYAIIMLERTNAKIWIAVLGISFGLGLMSKYAKLGKQKFCGFQRVEIDPAPADIIACVAEGSEGVLIVPPDIGR